MPPSHWYDPLPATLLAAFVVFVLGMVSAVLVEWLKRLLFRPRLEVVLHERKPGFVVRTKVPGSRPGVHESKYLRVGVTNVSRTRTIAKSCRAYLTDVKEIDSVGNLIPTFFADTMRLRWAYEGQDANLHEGIDLPNSIILHFDVMSTKFEVGSTPEDIEDLRIIQVANQSVRDRHFKNRMEYGKRYRFTIMVTAEGAEPIQLFIDIDMGSSWEDFRLLDPEARPIRGRKP